MICWGDQPKEEVVRVVNIATGMTFLMKKQDRVKIGSNEKISVLEEVEPEIVEFMGIQMRLPRYLERTFIGRFLELTFRVVVPRMLYLWGVDYCDNPVKYDDEEEAKCLCVMPHVQDQSSEVEKYNLDDVLTKVYDDRGFLRFRITQIDEHGAWGTLIE